MCTCNLRATHASSSILQHWNLRKSNVAQLWAQSKVLATTAYIVCSVSATFSAVPCWSAVWLLSLVRAKPKKKTGQSVPCCCSASQKSLNGWEGFSTQFAVTFNDNRVMCFYVCPLLLLVLCDAPYSTFRVLLNLSPKILKCFDVCLAMRTTPWGAESKLLPQCLQSMICW